MMMRRNTVAPFTSTQMMTEVSIPEPGREGEEIGSLQDEVCIYKRRRVRLILLSHSLPHKHTHNTTQTPHKHHTQIHTHNTHNSTHTPHTQHTTPHNTTHTPHHTTYYYWCVQNARARATCKAVCGSSTQSTSFIVKAITISLEIIPRYSCLIYMLH